LITEIEARRAVEIAERVQEAVRGTLQQEGLNRLRKD
jgi:hypothetical protein